MNKLNKKTIIYILIIIACIGIYMFFTKENDNIEEELMINNTQKDNTKENQENDENTKIVVYITGAIKNPGVYELEDEKRIADLIKEAGGVTEEADTNSINMAYKLEDEMKVYIPTKTEETVNIEETTETHIYTENNNQEKQEINTNSSKNQKININTASQTELETLPGIGPSTALKIIEYRKESGKFRNIEDIKNVKGIGTNKYEKIKELIKV